MSEPASTNAAAGMQVSYLRACQAALHAIAEEMDRYERYDFVSTEILNRWINAVQNRTGYDLGHLMLSASSNPADLALAAVSVAAFIDQVVENDFEVKVTIGD